MGSPIAYDSYLRDLLRDPGIDVPRTAVPASIPIPHYDAPAMPDIDLRVKTQGRDLMFTYGQNDPWSAEPSAWDPGPRTFTDSPSLAATTTRLSPTCPPRSAHRPPRRSGGGPD